MSTIDRSEGKRAFGNDPEGYHCARPEYPERVFQILRQRCRLHSPCRTFEIGAGTGLCTRRLIELGASPLVVVEPDERLSAFLTRTLGTLDIRVTTFENADLPSEWFDLGTSASAFHWLDETSSLAKIGRVLRDGGWWAAWWNLFFDGSRIDAFHEATQSLFEGLEHSPSRGDRGRPSFAMDAEARISSMTATGLFEDIAFEAVPWSLTLTTEQVVGLYSTFSPISRLDPEERHRVLSELRRIAEMEFGGLVELHVNTPIYTARRKYR